MKEQSGKYRIKYEIIYYSRQILTISMIKHHENIERKMSVADNNLEYNTETCPM